MARALKERQMSDYTWGLEVVYRIYAIVGIVALIDAFALGAWLF